jgi:hypothetical protein
MKTPPHPEDVAESLRDHIKSGNMTLTDSEMLRIIMMLERLSQRCGEAYQVVGALADTGEKLGDPAVQRALDLLSYPLRPGDILPFKPAFLTEERNETLKQLRARYRRKAKAKPGAKATSKKKKRPSRPAG